MGVRIAGATLICAVLAGAGGYGLGATTASDDDDALTERHAAQRTAFIQARAEGKRDGVRRGLRAGLSTGRKTGSEAGTRSGTRTGAAEADTELAQVEAEQEAVAQAATEYQAQIYCPITASNLATPEECAAANATESYCGGPDSPEC